MKELFETFWNAIKVIVEEYVFAQESTGNSGSAKKKAVVEAVAAVIGAAAGEFKLPALAVALVKFFLPYLVDAIVAKLNSQGKLNPHAALQQADGSAA